MSKDSTESVPVHDRQAPVLGIGVLAGIVASTILVSLDPLRSFVPLALVYGATLFVAAAFAVQFASSSLLEVWLILNAGVAVGVFIHVCFYHGANVGGRNLWPFEIVAFWLFGFIPCWTALWLGRRYKVKRRGAKLFDQG
jgi:uncharacterized membrane protein YjdF